MVPVLFGPWATVLIEHAKPVAGDRVLDLACGTGVVARQVAPRLQGNGTLVGLDLNPAMLDVARASSGDLAIEWRQGRAEALAFDDGAFDLVLCQFGLMFFADRGVALTESRRVLGERGRIALSVWQGLDRHPFYDQLHRVIEQRIGVSALADIFSLGGEAELRSLLEGAGFERPRIEARTMTARFPSPEAFLAGEIAVDTAAIPSMQHLDDAARQEVVAAISGDMEVALREVTSYEHVVLPFHGLVATASR